MLLMQLLKAILPLGRERKMYFAYMYFETKHVHGILTVMFSPYKAKIVSTFDHLSAKKNDDDKK